MNETQPQDRPTTTDPETEDLADLVERAEAGDQPAEVAIEEAGGPGGATDEPEAEAAVEIAQEAEPAREDDVTDVPSEEATLLEAAAEEALPEAAEESAEETPAEAAPDEAVPTETEAEFTAYVQGVPYAWVYRLPAPPPRPVGRASAPERQPTPTRLLDGREG